MSRYYYMLFSFIAGALSVYILIGITHSHILSDSEYKTLNYKSQLCVKYNNYFTSTETLLDSLLINPDDSIFETKTGVNYLNSSWELKELIDQGK